MKNTKYSGFTLIELMIILAVIGVLSYIVSSKVGNVLTKAREGTAKADLGSIRSAITIYYSDNLSIFPSGPVGNNQSVLSDALVPKYISKIPVLEVYPYHDEISTVDTFSNGTLTADGGEWAYYSDSSFNTHWGTIAIGCTHSDSKNIIWSSY